MDMYLYIHSIIYIYITNVYIYIYCTDAKSKGGQYFVKEVQDHAGPSDPVAIPPSPPADACASCGSIAGSFCC